MNPALSSLVHRRERVYHAVMAAIGVAVYAGIGLFIWNSEDGVAVAAMLLVYAAPVSLLLFLARGLALGRIRGNGIRVSERQFPELMQRPGATPQRSDWPGRRTSKCWSRS